MMVLYSGTTCPYSHRCRFVLFEKGMDFEIRDVDLYNKPEDISVMNPYGQVPILVERDLILYESNIINEYIDERFPHPQLMPGDPVDMMVASNPKITAEDVARLKSLYGLDQPVYKRYASWMGSILQGDLGYSRTYRVPVQELMGPRLWNTFLLSAISLILSIAIAVPLLCF